MMFNEYSDVTFRKMVIYQIALTKINLATCMINAIDMQNYDVAIVRALHHKVWNTSI